MLLLRVLMADRRRGWATRTRRRVADGASRSSIGVLGAITAPSATPRAFVQNNIKRLLAYSSIAHAGYMLCALSLLVRHNARVGRRRPARRRAAQAILLYLAVYLFMNLGAFTVAGLISRADRQRGHRRLRRPRPPLPVLACVHGRVHVQPVGLPPLAGFVAKVNVMWVLVQNGGWWWALVAVIGVNTIVSLYYYVRVVKVDVPRAAATRRAFSREPARARRSASRARSCWCCMFVGCGPLTNLTTGYSDAAPRRSRRRARPPQAAPRRRRRRRRRRD